MEKMIMAKNFIHETATTLFALPLGLSVAKKKLFVSLSLSNQGSSGGSLRTRAELLNI